MTYVVCNVVPFSLLQTQSMINDHLMKESTLKIFSVYCNAMYYKLHGIKYVYWNHAVMGIFIMLIYSFDQ